MLKRTIASGVVMKDKRLNNEITYHLRKSLISLNRALRQASDAGDVATCQEIKKCLTLITKQIKILSVKK